MLHRFYVSFLGVLWFLVLIGSSQQVGAQELWVESAGDISTNLGGNVGIGTPSPSTELHIKGDPIITLEKTGTKSAGIKVIDSTVMMLQGDDQSIQYFSFYSTLSKNRVNDSILRIHGKGTDTWGNRLTLRHNGNSGVVNTDTGNLRLEAGGGANVLLNKSGVGNVGIGVAVPQSRLDVGGTITADALNLVGNLSAGSLNVTLDMDVGGHFDVQTMSAASITTSTLNLTNGLMVQSLNIPGLSGIDLGVGSYVKPFIISGLEKLQLHGPVGTEVLGDFTVSSNGQTRLQDTTITGFLAGQGAHFGDLGVGGKIEAMEIEVTMNPVPDYVFADDYELTPLLELEAEIEELGHLPKFPSAEEVAAKGGRVNLGEMNRKLLETVEELTLYLIDLKKENDTLHRRMDALENEQRGTLEDGNRS